MLYLYGVKKLSQNSIFHKKECFHNMISDYRSEQITGEAERYSITTLQILHKRFISLCKEPFSVKNEFEIAKLRRDMRSMLQDAARINSAI